MMFAFDNHIKRTWYDKGEELWPTQR